MIICAGQNIPISAEVRVAKLHSSYCASYHSLVGRNIQQRLLQRSSTQPYRNLSVLVRELGELFSISAYRLLTVRLARIMHTMELNLSRYHGDANTYTPNEHIIQIGGPPGYGKTTAGELSWVALQQAMSSVDDQQWRPIDVDQACWARMRSRVQASFTPNRMLLFKLDFRTGAYW